MEDSRDVQTSRPNRSSRSVLSAGSAVAMEIKRKKIRQSTLFLPTENTNLQEKLDFELRMRDGAYRLLLASSKREQVLNVSKNLLTCTARIKAYNAQLQRKREEPVLVGDVGRSAEGRVACNGTIAVTGLRFPLLWRDSDHFNNRGSSRRVAAFCLMQIGSEVFDTEMVVVDRTVTDICFEGITSFKDVDPQFDLRVELWSCALEEELTLVNTPKKLAKKLRNSFGKSSGKKLCSLLDTPDPDTFLQNNPIPPGAKYSLLAYTTLGLPDADENFQSHSLIVYQDAEWSSWLPLYGNLCCRFVAQPACMTQSGIRGFLSQKQSVEGVSRCCTFYCSLSAGVLSCYFTPEEIEAKVPPALNIPINKETCIQVLSKGSGGHRARSLSIINPSADGPQAAVFTADSRDELEEWLDALHQHLYDQSQWLHCCHQLMKIEVASPRKPSLFLTKQADSVYNDLSISSPGKFESVTDIIHSKIQETDGRFLLGHEEKEEAPNWSSLFDGSHSIMVERSVLSQGKASTPCSSPSKSSTPLSSKKRRAPPPPSDIKPFAPPTCPSRPPPPCSLLHHAFPSEKENSGTVVSRPAARSKTGRPSLDAKFSSIIQQLQRSNAAGGTALRKNAPLAALGVDRQENQESRRSEDPSEQGFSRAYVGSGPVPAPRSKLRKSFRDRMNLKA